MISAGIAVGDAISRSCKAVPCRFRENRTRRRVGVGTRVMIRFLIPGSRALRRQSVPVVCKDPTCRSGTLTVARGYKHD